MRLTYLALALAGGISIGRISPPILLWPWLALATVFLVGAELLRRRKWPRLMLSCLIGATGTMGTGGYLLHEYYRSPRDLAAMIGEEPVLVRVRGVAQASPKRRDRTSGSNYNQHPDSQSGFFYAPSTITPRATYSIPMRYPT